MIFILNSNSLFLCYFRLKDSKETISAQVDVVNRILKFIEQEWNTQGIETSLYQLSEEDKLMFLRGIYSKVGLTKEQVEAIAKTTRFFSATEIFGRNTPFSAHLCNCLIIKAL